MQYSEEQIERPSTGWRIYLVFGFLLICGLSYLVQYGTWTVEQTITLLGKEMPAWGRILPSAVQIALVALYLGAGALTCHREAYRRIILGWLVFALFAILCLPVRNLEANHAQAANLLQIGACVLFAAGLTLSGWRWNSGGFAGIRKALLIAPLCIWPWLVWGAFGSPLDILLNLAAGVGFGYCCAGVLARFFIRDASEKAPRAGRSLFASCLAAGAGMLLAASVFGYNGLQLTLMTLMLLSGLFAFGFLPSGRNAGAEASTGAQFQAPGWGLLAGLICAAPMVMVDADELAMILNMDVRDSAYWSSLALGASAVMILACALAAGHLNRPTDRSAGGRLPVTAGLLLLWTGLGAATWLGGRVGFHGDHLFVVMREQADLRPADEISDALEKRTWVYGQLVDTAERSQRDLRDELDRLGIPWKPYYVVNALEIQLDQRPGEWLLANRADVATSYEIPALRPLPAPYEEVHGAEKKPEGTLWNLRMIEAQRVWRELGVNGKGIVVGQSDSGAEWDHPELIETYRGWDAASGEVDHDGNWLDAWYGEAQPYDLNGHGTHTLGSVLGKSVGVAPGALWYACGNLARNLGNPARYLDCMQFMLAPHPQHGDPLKDGRPERGAHVTNNSWGCPDTEGCRVDTLAYASTAMKAAGVFMVVSAGNEGMDCGTINTPPAIYADVLSVGAVDRTGRVVGFSSRGPVTVDGSMRIKPEIVAPGASILSAYPGKTYEFADGTSMAGPHVTGVVALMWSANPDLIGDVESTRRILLETVDPYRDRLNMPCTEGATVPSNEAGYGVVNAYQAVKKALEIKGESAP